MTCFYSRCCVDFVYHFVSCCTSAFVSPCWVFDRLLFFVSSRCFCVSCWVCCSYLSVRAIHSRCCNLLRSGCVLKLAFVGIFVPAVVFLLLSWCCSCRFCLCVIRSRCCLVHPAGCILGEITAWCAIILTILVFGIVKSLLSCGNWSAVQIIRVFTEQVGSSLERLSGRLRPVTGLKLPTIPEVLV